MAKPTTAPILKLPEEQKLAELILHKFIWKENESLGFLSCCNAHSDFLCTVLIPKALERASTITVLCSTESSMQIEQVKLEKSMKSKFNNEVVRFKKINLKEFHQLTFPEDSKFDKFICLYDLWFFEDVKAFFQHLADKIMKSNCQIGFVVAFSKIYEIPKRFFSTDKWSEFDKYIKGKPVPGYRISSWACNPSHDHIKTILDSVTSSTFKILDSDIKDGEVKNVSQFLKNIMMISYSESFAQINDNWQLDRCLIALAEIARDYLGVPSLTPDSSFQVSHTFLTFVADKN